MRSTFRGLGLLLCALAIPPALAQAPLPDDMAKGKKRTPQIQQKAPPAPVAVDKPAPAPAAPPANKAITINRFEFAGNTLYDGATLEGQVRSYLNRPVTLLELYEAADRVAAFYAGNGYTLASVNVPPQKIEGGVVRLLVSEGRIETVTAEGNNTYSESELKGFLGDVQPGRVYRAGELEERMRMLNTLPGLSARAVLKPGDNYGTSAIVVKVAEDPFSGAFILDNHGRENIGEMRYTAYLQFNNPFGVADQLQLLGLRSEDGLLNYAYGAYSVPVNFSGTRLTGSFGYADFRVAGSPVDGKNRSGKLEVDHPLVRSASNTLDVSAGVSRTRSNADIIGITFNGTAITLLELGAIYNHTYADLGVTQVVTNIATNFDELSRNELGGTAVRNTDQRLRWELDIQHLQPLPQSLQLFTRLNGVYSPDPLADTQAYALGGPDSVRGYPAAEVRGDRGYFASLGLRRPFSIGKVSMAGRVFGDTGKVFVVDPLPGTTKNETLSSVGLGADAQYDRLSLRLDWSLPRDNHKASDGQDDNRLFGSFSVSF